METSQETYIPIERERILEREKMVRKAKSRLFNRAIIFALFILFVITSGTTFYFYNKTVALKTTPPVEVKNETADLISKVSKIILLPEGELPTIATVSNPEELQEQPFFAKAKIGDKVLLYPIAKKAYLYDPVANMIIEVSSITPETAENTNTGTTSNRVETR